jgi:GNAT superfamily N-acetyltransferase
MSIHKNTGTAPTPQRVALASAVGATIEWYDFFLYGTAAAVVFDKLYFNGLDGPAAQFAAFATFAVGFFARPIGGLVFGHYGDRIGRKQMLLLTLVIMGVGTALMQRYIDHLDQKKTAGYLETDRPENVEFYKRFGFIVQLNEELIGAPIWYMWRPARG